jgi:membrane protease YdiL (CAAX protease family)
MNHAVKTDAPNTAGSSPITPIVGVLIAIAATTTMDVTGLSNFSALALLPLMLLFWYLERLPCSEMGFRRAKPAHYTVGLLYPLVVIGLIASVATFAGVVDLSKTNWQKAALNLLIVTISTTLIAIVTEEGIFQGLALGIITAKTHQ